MKIMEIALGEALRVMRPRKKREKRSIRVCDECGVPMLWTFFIPYCERYCLNCGYAGGMLGTGRDVEATKERILQMKMVEAVFKVLRNKIMPGGKFGRTGCKKESKDGGYSSSCNDHGSHLTKSEIEWDKIARKYLKHLNKKKLFPPQIINVK